MIQKKTNQAKIYLAVLYSEWHTDVLLGLIEIRHIEKVSIIYLNEGHALELKKPPAQNIKRIGQKTIRKLNANKKVELIDININSWLKKRFKNRYQNTLVVINPGGLSIRLCQKFKRYALKIEVIAIDEGTSTYLPPSRRGVLRESKHRIGVTIKMILMDLVKYISGGLYKNFYLDSYEEFFYLKNGKVNRDFVDALKKVYCNGQTIRTNNSIILLIKDYDLEMFTVNKSIEIWGYTLNYLRMNFEQATIVMKVHPNEPQKNIQLLKEKLNIVVLDGKTQNAELLCSKLNPILVVGGISTVLFTCSEIFSTTSISIAPMYIKNCLNWKYISRINQLIKTFRNTTKGLTFLSNETELNSNLLELKGSS